MSWGTVVTGVFGSAAGATALNFIQGTIKDRRTAKTRAGNQQSQDMRSINAAAVDAVETMRSSMKALEDRVEGAEGRATQAEQKLHEITVTANAWLQWAHDAQQLFAAHGIEAPPLPTIGG